MNKFLILIIIIAAFLRFYKLSSNPPGLYWDEAALGYNAYSVLKTGRDEYGSFLPMSFRSFDDYKNPVYVYLLVPTIAVFGLNEFAVRFPSAIFGTFTVILLYFLTKKIFKSEKTSLISALILAVLPWHLQFSRGGFEANVMLFFNVAGVLFFLYSFKNYKYLILSAVSFGLSMNTYHAAKLWVPLFLFCISFIYRKELLGLGKKTVIPIVIIFIFILPILLNYQQTLSRGKTVSILSKPNAAENFITGYLSHFSPSFLFISGDSQERHSVHDSGELLVFQLPFIMIGLIYLIKKRNKNANMLLSWLILSPIPAAVSEPAPHALRFITSVPLWSIFTAIGMMVFFKANFSKTFLKISSVIIALVVTYNLITYFHLYYVHYPKESGPAWQEGYREMLTYVKSQQDNYDTVGITAWNGAPYIFTLFYTKYDPKTYQSQTKGNLNSFGKYKFFKSGGGYLENSGKTLIVTTSSDGNIAKTLKIISSNGNQIFRISEQ